MPYPEEEIITLIFQTKKPRLIKVIKVLRAYKG